MYVQVCMGKKKCASVKVVLQCAIVQVVLQWVYVICNAMCVCEMFEAHLITLGGLGLHECMWFAGMLINFHPAISGTPGMTIFSKGHAEFFREFFFVTN